MTPFRLIPLAEDIAWHATGIAQGLFDVASVVVLALAVYATDGGVRPVVTAQTATPPSVICVANCITAEVLARQDS